MPKRILIMDDDWLLLRAVERFLKDYGYDVEIAQSDKAALEKIEELEFDLVISNLLKSGQDGIGTLKKIKEISLHRDREKLPAIVITDYFDEEIQEKKEELGIIECIYRPFMLDEFIEVLRKTLELPPKYKRSYPRIEVTFPVEVTVKDTTGKVDKINGKLVDLSENGVGLILESLLPLSSVVHIYVNPTGLYTPFEMEALVVWSKPIFREKTGFFRYGLHCLRLEEKDRLVLKKIFSDYRLLPEEYVSLTKELRRFLQDIKDRCDSFDRLNRNVQGQIDFVRENKKEIFEKLDNNFSQTWKIVKDFERDRYIVHQKYYQQILGPLLIEPIEINRHIYQKPFGYSGDYVLLNYFYNYHNENNLLGNSLFEKLINNYTCRTSRASSYIKRKEFIKEKIITTLKRKEKLKILSIGSGPLRELIELLKEDRGVQGIFICLDFKKEPLNYIENEIRKIRSLKRKLVSLQYICKEIMAIITDERLRRNLMGCDLIYSLQAFDHLSDWMVSRLIKELYQLLGKEGELLIFNAIQEDGIDRIYFEFLGEWKRFYRSKEWWLSQIKEIPELKEVEFEASLEVGGDLLLNIKKIISQ